MKITATKKEDLLKQKEEYDARLQSLKDRRAAEDFEYRKAGIKAEKAVERKILTLIGPTSLEIRINADEDWSPRRSGEDLITWEIDIRVNENRKFKDDTALAWSWRVRLVDGKIRKESSSWSGLQAVTPEQIADLEESVKVIKALNAIDWDEVVHAPYAKFEDYHDPELGKELRQVSKDRPNFEDQISAEELNELLGGDIALALKQDQYYRGKCWILPTKITDKFISGYIFPDYYLSRKMTPDQIRENADERRTARSNLIKDWDTKKFETVDLNKLAATEPTPYFS